MLLAALILVLPWLAGCSGEGGTAAVTGAPAEAQTTARTEPQAPTDAPSSEPAAAPTELKKRIVYRGIDDSDSLFVKCSDDLDISYPLYAAARQEEYSDCLFAVRIELLRTYDDLWNELRALLAEAASDPYCVKYDEGHEAWVVENIFPLSNDEICERYGLSSMEGYLGHDEYGIQLSYYLTCEEYSEYLRETDPDAEALIAAHEYEQECWHELYGRRTRINKAISEAVALELERLGSLGLCVCEGEDGLFVEGFLTPDQILSFPAGGVYGYHIVWQAPEDRS